MVNFDNEATVGTPAVDVVRIIVLQRRYDLMEAWEDYKKREARGGGGSLSLVQARVWILFMELQAMLKRMIKDETELNQLKKMANSDSEEDLLVATEIINGHLDAMKLTRLDTRKQYDKTKWETENRMKNL